VLNQGIRHQCSAHSANKIVSSAYSNTNTSIDILKFARHFCDTVWRPVMLLLHKLSSISEGNTADKNWFSKHKRSYDYEFKLYGVNIGIGNSYSYFCLLFNYNDNFTIILPSPERNYLSKLKMLFMGNWEIFQFLLISNLNYSILFWSNFIQNLRLLI
jgi:hypothetical protein